VTATLDSPTADTPAAKPPWGRWAAVAAIVTVALGLGGHILSLVPDADTDRLTAGGRAIPVMVLVLGWAFVAIGCYAWLRRPENGTGRLLALFGLVALASNLTISDDEWVYLLGVVTDTLVLSVFLHAALAFPSGRLDGRASRIVVAGAYGSSALAFVGLLVGGWDPVYGCDGCPENPIVIVDSDPTVAIGGTLAGLIGFSVVIATVVIIIRRWRRSSPFQRRALGPPAAAGIVVLVGVVVWSLVQGIGYEELEKWVQIVFVGTFGLLPIGFLAGLLRVSFFRTSTLGTLIEQLARQPGAGGLEEALGGALGDPDLTVAFWLPERGVYVDAEGRELGLPEDDGDRVATEIVHRGRRIGALVHDAKLLAERELVQTVTGTAALALENGRLEAELRARLEALQASRARIVEAGDSERRRLGRDLHDGAQQRLVSILLRLQLVHEGWGKRPEADHELVEQALADARAAVEELRELAAGIHPAVLSQRGLDAALESLAMRATVPVELESELDQRFPAAVESAAYFTVAEGLTNVAKYANATHATVSASRDDGELVVAVRDDGVGGATLGGGSGLRGLEDRVGAVGGTLEVDSPQGEGTVLRARIPV
jgi:signal transduction histidine kinase